MTILARIRQAQRRRQAARELRALPPELLNDIGIEPDRIDEAVASIEARAPRAIGAEAPLTTPVASRGDWPYSTRPAA